MAQAVMACHHPGAADLSRPERDTMPHLTIEFTSNVADHHDLDELLDAIHTTVLESAIGPVAGLRIRAVEHTHYRVADGDPSFAFVAMYARLGPGRDLATRQAFIETVLDAGEAALAGTPLRIIWSMEVAEIDPDVRVNRNHVAPVLEERRGG